MKLTIVVADGVVGIDGEFRQLDLSQLSPNVRAVQWGGQSGHVEYNDGRQNTVLSSLTNLSGIIDAWNALTPPPPIPPTLEDLKIKVIEQVKSERDRLTVTGGHKVGAYWYHSNEMSLIQQLALNGIANQMSGAGATDSTAIIATPWKTLSGEYVTLTVGIAKQFIQSALMQQSNLFTNAQTKIDEVIALTTVEAVEAYNVTTGFAEVFH